MKPPGLVASGQEELQWAHSFSVPRDFSTACLGYLLGVTLSMVWNTLSQLLPCSPPSWSYRFACFYDVPSSPAKPSVSWLPSDFLQSNKEGPILLHTPEVVTANWGKMGSCQGWGSRTKPTELLFPWTNCFLQSSGKFRQEAPLKTKVICLCFLK